MSGSTAAVASAETPAAPVVETPAAPTSETPAAPVVETPAPVAETPAAPTNETPAAPVVETPAAPEGEAPAAPTGETPGASTLAMPLAPAIGAPIVPPAETVWLCKPDLAVDPCLSSEEATVELGNGSTSVELAKPATDPPIDCFYVYPTVSSQAKTEHGHLVNANLEIGPEETQIAIDQASRFSQTCKVYAPIYPQLTLLRSPPRTSSRPKSQKRPISESCWPGRNTSPSTTTAAASS